MPSRFVQYVNKVVRLHKAFTLEEFKVSFELNEKFKCDIDNWLKFASAKKVQRLVLDLSWQGLGIRSDHKIKSYTLSYGMLSQANGTSTKRSSNCCSIQCFKYVAFESLKVLCLHCVDVTGEVLEGFLSSCPPLEKLSVLGSEELVRLKVHGPSLILKYLEIGYCRNIASIEMSNVNLVTLVYRGRRISWVLESAPMLVELNIGGMPYLCLTELLPQLSCCFSQLETLTMKIDRKEFEGFNVPLEFSNLKKLVLISTVSDDISLLGYMPLIRASPFLQKFVLQEPWCFLQEL